MSAVTQAVLLAAGRGTRLGALTDAFPKAMLEVGDQPIIHRIIGGLAEAGVTDLAIVTGHCAEVLEAGTGHGDRWGVRIRYVRQSTPEGTARALSLARPTLGSGPFFVGWGDILVEPANYAKVLDAAKDAAAVLAVNEVDDPYAGGAVYADANWRVSRIIEKPPRGTSTTHLNNAGLFVLPDSIWPFVEGLQPSTRGEFELPQAIAVFVAAGNLMTAVPITGPWFDVGTRENLAAARHYFAPTPPPA
ncbi:MAG: nucleotidyltransferase family protein [Dehalococcoidia bacterium]